MPTGTNATSIVSHPVSMVIVQVPTSALVAGDLLWSRITNSNVSVTVLMDVPMESVQVPIGVFVIRVM